MNQANAASISVPHSIAQPSSTTSESCRPDFAAWSTFAADAASKPSAVSHTPYPTMPVGGASRASCTTSRAMPAIPISEPTRNRAVTGWPRKTRASRALGSISKP